MAVRLRASPAIGVGGMYATGQGVDHFVVTAAMVPDVWERQKVRRSTYYATLD